MKKSWDDKAKKNAYHWVDSTKENWQSSEEYYERGEQEVKNKLISPLNEWGFDTDDFKKAKVLDIGCGTGRLTRALAKYVQQVDGIDISEEMLKKASKDNDDVTNAQFFQGNGVDLESLKDDEYDFVFSFIVFQHIPSKPVVEKYIKEIHRVIKKGGVARFQVRGYPGRLRGNLPSFLYKGFNSFYIALDLKKGFIPVPVVKKYTTVYGCFFKKGEIKKLLEDKYFNILELEQDQENQRYLWITVQK